MSVTLSSYQYANVWDGWYIFAAPRQTCALLLVSPPSLETTNSLLPIFRRNISNFDRKDESMDFALIMLVSSPCSCRWTSLNCMKISVRNATIYYSCFLSAYYRDHCLFLEEKKPSSIGPNRQNNRDKQLPFESHQTSVFKRNHWKSSSFSVHSCWNDLEFKAWAFYLFHTIDDNDQCVMQTITITQFFCFFCLFSPNAVYEWHSEQ